MRSLGSGPAGGSSTTQPPGVVEGRLENGCSSRLDNRLSKIPRDSLGLYRHGAQDVSVVGLPGVPAGAADHGKSHAHGLHGLGAGSGARILAAPVR